MFSNLATVTLTVGTPLVPGDINGDGKVDLTDFGLLKANFGTGDTRAEGDLDGNGQVDLTDFGILKANFGSTGVVAQVAMAAPLAESEVGGLANVNLATESAAAWQRAIDALFEQEGFRAD